MDIRFSGRPSASEDLRDVGGGGGGRSDSGRNSALDLFPDSLAWGAR